jgi:uncharacterized protein (TIRG00374 family)
MREQPFEAPIHPAPAAPSSRSQPRWRLALGVLMSAAILALAFVNRAWLWDAISLARAAQPAWLLLGLATILGSFLISSQVFQVALRALGHRAGVLRLWATAVAAIITSQVIPAGAVGSYAFLLDSLRRRGASSSEAALVATLEALSYAGAMLIFALFGLAYLASRILAADPDGSSLLAPLLAVGAVLLLLGISALLLTRPAGTLRRWLGGLNVLLARALRRPLGDAWAERAVAELVRVRGLVATLPWMLAALVLIQLTALCGHSLGLYFILRSLGVSASFLTILAAFGIALLTSTINVLPGGGGTVEAAIVAVLTQLGVGAEAVPAAILFRLINFWLMLPIAAGCYAWLARERRGGSAREPRASR